LWDKKKKKVNENCLQGQRKIRGLGRKITYP